MAEPPRDSTTLSELSSEVPQGMVLGPVLFFTFQIARLSADGVSGVLAMNTSCILTWNRQENTDYSSQ